MSKNKDIDESTSENPFALSTGDLMAALLFIFILLLSATMLKITEQQDDINNMAKQYYQKKHELYTDLDSIFADSLKSWDAEIDSTDLIVRFNEPKTLFDYNKTDLKPRFKDILNYFFPKYIELLSSSKYKESVEEIRIEGHTDNDGSYYFNMELSQNRTRAVLEHCLDLLKDKESVRKWSMERITANGLSYSHPILNDDGNIDAIKSRRVEFRVKTNAEKKLSEIMDTLYVKQLSKSTK